MTARWRVERQACADAIAHSRRPYCWVAIGPLGWYHHFPSYALAMMCATRRAKKGRVS